MTSTNHGTEVPVSPEAAPPRATTPEPTFVEVSEEEARGLAAAGKLYRCQHGVALFPCTCGLAKPIYGYWPDPDTRALAVSPSRASGAPDGTDRGAAMRDDELDDIRQYAGWEKDAEPHVLRAIVRQCVREIDRLRALSTGEPSPDIAALTFDALRAANTARLPLFKNRKGEPAHSQPDGSDWSLGEWANAVLGELGEAANLIKKVQRGDVTLDEARADLAEEFADVVTYLDILAFRAGVALGLATAAKWDKVSARVGVSLRIADFRP